ncbi:MAG: hypothetical protein CM15mP58_19500 [Burkholderiaceae bacterium]|nr:MAG: hypothetical protein CM15mP58_19500 [Burkholderiaceae bacterium]
MVLHRRQRRGGWGRVIKRRRRRAAGQAKAKAMAKRRRKSKSKGKGRGARKSGGRDPLCQSFSVNETGAFLTSFDVYFASKDPNAKLTVQLRTMELGTPTPYLVQDFCELVVSPDDINVSNDTLSQLHLDSSLQYICHQMKNLHWCLYQHQLISIQCGVQQWVKNPLKQHNYPMFKTWLYLSSILVVVYLNHRMVQFGLQAKTKT